MCKNLLRKYGQEGLQEFTCFQVKENRDKWLSQFRETNRSDVIEKSGQKDKRFIEYMEEIDNFISKCKDKISDTCEKCIPEDHEGCFCRCESRNIALAKQKRSEGNSPWKIE